MPGSNSYNSLAIMPFHLCGNGEKAWYIYMHVDCNTHAQSLREFTGHRYTSVFFHYAEKNHVIAVLFKVVESAFRDAVVCGLSALACSHLTLKEEKLLSVKVVYKGRTCLCGY